VCYLWPEGAIQAPRPSEESAAPIQWLHGQDLIADVEAGSIRLRWSRPRGPVVGYDVLCSEDGQPFQRRFACRRESQLDDLVIAGRTYRYRVVPFDAGGRRGIPSESVEVSF
jgi:hypothetical protein